MSKFKSGDVCEIIDTYSKFSEFRGMECTIVGLLDIRKEPWYNIIVKGIEQPYHIGESCLKLIKPPKPSAEDEAFRSFMSRVMKPVEICDEEVVK